MSVVDNLNALTRSRLMHAKIDKITVEGYSPINPGRFVSSLDTAGSRDKVITHCQNMYLDLDGTLHPHLFPKSGLYKFDGQVYWPAD